MKTILNYKSFNKLNEKYEEDPEYRIKVFFNKLEKNIRLWFSEGSFAINGAELYDINVATTNNIDKTLIFDFQDKNYYYQVIVIVSLEDVNESTLSDCYIKVKRYDLETSELLKEVGKNVLVKDLNEDKLIEIFADLDEEESLLDDEGNLETSTEEENLEEEPIPEKESTEEISSEKEEVQTSPESQSKNI